MMLKRGAARLVLAGGAAAAMWAGACGGAAAQRAGGLPPYEDVLDAVRGAGCESSEGAYHLRYICEDSRAVWYFTKPGDDAHPAYAVKPAWGVGDAMPDEGPQFGSGNTRERRFTTPEAVSTRSAAFSKWQLFVDRLWRESKPRLSKDEEARRDARRNKRLWPAE